ncbi:MAG TPA: hypothetical protein VF623_13775 [Segetibacter sp.]|jgi:tetratricopeptide (TPR) repeat protein
MQPTLTEETAVAEPATTAKCLGCGSTDVLTGFANPLCAGCREGFIKFPFPTWIKAFGIGVGIVVVFSLLSFFGNLQTGVHMARGEKAENGHNYLTAQREFETVLKKLPEHVEAKAHLLIAAFYNADVATFTKTADALTGKTFEDQELFAKADNVMTMGLQFYPSDSMAAIYEKYKNDSVLPAQIIEDYYSRSPGDVSAGLKIASDAFDKKDYVKADTVLKKMIDKNPENLLALSMMSSVKRYQKDAAGAMPYLDQLLVINKEHLYACRLKPVCY